MQRKTADAGAFAVLRDAGDAAAAGAAVALALFFAFAGALAASLLLFGAAFAYDGKKLKGVSEG